FQICYFNSIQTICEFFCDLEQISAYWFVYIFDCRFCFFDMSAADLDGFSDCIRDEELPDQRIPDTSVLPECRELLFEQRVGISQKEHRKCIVAIFKI